MFASRAECVTAGIIRFNEYSKCQEDQSASKKLPKAAERPMGEVASSNLGNLIVPAPRQEEVDFRNDLDDAAECFDDPINDRTNPHVTIDLGINHNLHEPPIYDLGTASISCLQPQLQDCITTS